MFVFRSPAFPASLPAAALGSSAAVTGSRSVAGVLWSAVPLTGPALSGRCAFV